MLLSAYTILMFSKQRSTSPASFESSTQMNGEIENKYFQATGMTKALVQYKALRLMYVMFCDSYFSGIQRSSYIMLC